MVTRLSVVLGSLFLSGAALGFAAGPARTGVKCKVDSVVDTEASGMKAFTFLVPDGWVAHTSFKWMPPTRTAFSSDLSINTPDIHTIVDCVEHTVLEYQSGFGNGPSKGVMIQKASDFLRYRVSKLAEGLKDVTDMQVVDEQNTELPPDDAQKIGAQYANRDSMHQRTFLSQAGFLKVRFNYNGTPMTASLGTTVYGETSVIRIPGRSTPTSVSQVNRVGPTLTIMLEANAPAKRVEEAKIVANSFQMTPEFHTYWVKMTVHAAQVQIGINHAEQIANDTNWHERSMANFRNQMDAKSGVSHDFCNMVANQQDYRMGNSIVTLPNSFRGWYDAGANELLIGDNQFVPTGAGTNNFRALQPVTAANR